MNDNFGCGGNFSGQDGFVAPRGGGRYDGCGEERSGCSNLYLPFQFLTLHIECGWDAHWYLVYPQMP